MNYLYLLGGIASIGFGAALTIYQIRVFIRGKQDQLGWDIKGLSAGIIFTIIGIYLLTHL
jgi:hypothetical protein